MKFVPFTTVSLISCLTAVYCVHTDVYGTSKDWQGTITAIIVLIINNAIISITMVQPYRFDRKWTSLNETIMAIDNMLQQMGHKPYNISIVKKNYYTKVFLVALTAMLGASFKFILYRPMLLHWLTEFAYIYYRIFNYMVVLHVLFYVQLVNGLGKSIIRSGCGLNDRIAIVSSTENILSHLKHYKRMHHALSEATQLVNDIFGWVLTLVILQAPMDFTLSLYAVFQILMIDQVITVLRMYTFSSP